MMKNAKLEPEQEKHDFEVPRADDSLQMETAKEGDDTPA